MRKIKMGKYGINEDIRGLHVAMKYRGRTLLGEVRRSLFNWATGMTNLHVIHFCGDDWPITPHVLSVDVLD